MNTRDSIQSGSSVTSLTRLSLLLLLCVSSSASWAANQKPIANAGDNQMTGLAATVQLDGSLSRDDDGQIKKYRWQQIQGQKVKLLDAQTPIAHFETPAPLPSKQAARILSFRLTVTDDRKKSASDTVTITLSDCSAPRIVIGGECREPVPVCTAPQVLQDNRCITPPKPLSCTAPLVAIDGVCRLPPVNCTLPQVLQNGLCALPVPHANLNDTGITSCSDTEHNGKRCPLDAYPGQDAEFGRDVYFNDDRNGHAGFSFKKIAADGSTLGNDAGDWFCVQDQVTGLIWEIKRGDGGLHDQDKRFNYAEALDYVNAVNGETWCGAHDWRLPSAEELQMILDYGVVFPGPAIDQHFFPRTPNLPHWSGTPHAQAQEKAWVVYLDDGRVFDDVRTQRYPVRLVRQGAKP